MIGTLLILDGRIKLPLIGDPLSLQRSMSYFMLSRWIWNDNVVLSNKNWGNKTGVQLPIYDPSDLNILHAVLQTSVYNGSHREIPPDSRVIRDGGMVFLTVECDVF